MYPVVGEIIGWELLLVLAIAALLFGSSQLPKFARSLGSAKTEFEKGLKLGHTDEEKPDPKAVDTPASKDAGSVAPTTTVPTEPEKKPSPGDETSPTPK